MKKTLAKTIIAVFLVFCLVPSAYAGTSVSNSGGNNVVSSSNSLQERLKKVPDFLFKNHENGIGYGSIPVYTAPSEDAFRCADGKASCDSNHYMSEAGYDKSGWLLVRYETNKGGHRVGYVPPKYVKGFKSDMELPSFEYIPATAAETIYVTDDLYLRNAAFATLSQGETFYILGKYTYRTAVSKFWYIECYVDNQICRGFIDMDNAKFSLGENTSSNSNANTSNFLSYLNLVQSNDSYVSSSNVGYPDVSPLGTRQDGYFKMDPSRDKRAFVRERPDPDAEQVSCVYPGETYPCYGSQVGTTGKDWYYIWIEDDSTFGWVSSGIGFLNY